MYEQPKSDAKPPRKDDENARTLGSTAGGAILGASLGGPFGALVGGFVGLVLGEYVNDEKRKGGRR